MAKNWVTQDVYKNLVGIAKDKNEYEYNDSIGNTSERDKYGNQAVAKYDVIGAYSPELRATLKGSNAQQTRDLLKDYGVARDAKVVASDIIAKKFGYENAKAKDPNADLSEFDATALYDELAATDKGMADLLKNMSYQQAVEWQETGKMPSVFQVSGEVKEPVGTFNKGFDAILDYGKNHQNDVRTMYFDPNYGKDLMETFSAYGGAKGAQAAAGAAADNGGNLDSFADYNKKATDLSYKIAGANAVQDMRRGYAQDSTAFFDSYADKINENARDFADYEYKDKALASDEKVAMAQNATDRVQIASDERIAQMSADTQKAIAQIEADAESKGYSAETINAIISGVTDLILKGKDYSVLQGFLDQYGVKLPEQTATTTGTVVPSGFGGETEIYGTESNDIKYDNASMPITDDEYNKISAAGEDHQNDTTPEFLTWLTEDFGFSMDAAGLIGDHNEVATVINTLLKKGYKKEAYMFAAANGFDLENVKDTIK